MTIVTSRMTTRPERKDEFIQIFKGLMEPTRIEVGCIGYFLYQDIDNQNNFFLLEEWQSGEDLEIHIRSGRYKKFLGVMELLSKPPLLQIHTVSPSSGIEYIEEILGSDQKARNQ